MKATELRELTDDELRQRLDETRQALFNLRVQQAIGQMEKPSQLKMLRRDIARILTVMRERRKTEKSS